MTFFLRQVALVFWKRKQHDTVLTFILELSATQRTEWWFRDSRSLVLVISATLLTKWLREENSMRRYKHWIPVGGYSGALGGFIGKLSIPDPLCQCLIFACHQVQSLQWNDCVTCVRAKWLLSLSLRGIPVAISVALPGQSTLSLLGVRLGSGWWRVFNTPWLNGHKAISAGIFFPAS